MKFKFRLQSVLELRQHLEEEQKDVLAAERQKLNELFEQKENLLRNFKIWSKKYLELASAGMTPDEAVRTGRYIEEINRNIKLTDRQIQKQTENVERARVLLIERMQDRKALEKLYERQHERFKYDENKKAENEIADLITSRR